MHIGNMGRRRELPEHKRLSVPIPLEVRRSYERLARALNIPIGRAAAMVLEPLAPFVDDLARMAEESAKDQDALPRWAHRIHTRVARAYAEFVRALEAVDNDAETSMEKVQK